MFKRSAALLLCLLLLLSFLPVTAAGEGGTPAPAVAATRVALVVHPASGVTVFEKGGDTPAAPSGTVKLMVALLAWDALAGRLEEEVTITSEMLSETRGSGLGLMTGHRITVRDLFYGLLVRGANDCAQVLALLAGGTGAAFVQAMNTHAAALGMADTKYADYTGRSTLGAYTTARDVALLASAVHANATLRAMAAASSYRYTINGLTYVMYNRNDLCGTYYRDAYYDAQASGLCYGYTEEDGAVLVSYHSAPCGEYLLVLLGGADAGQEENVYTDAAALARYAAQEFAYREVLAAGTPCAQIPVRLSRESDRLLLVAQTSLRLFLPAAAMEEIHLRTEVTASSLTAPVERGTVLGEVIVVRGDTEIGRVPLVAACTVQRSVLSEVLSRLRAVVFSPVTILLVLAACATVFVLRFRRVREGKEIPPEGEEERDE